MSYAVCKFQHKNLRPLKGHQNYEKSNVLCDLLVFEICQNTSAVAGFCFEQFQNKNCALSFEISLYAHCQPSLMIGAAHQRPLNTTELFPTAGSFPTPVVLVGRQVVIPTAAVRRQVCLEVNLSGSFQPEGGIS